MNEKLKVDAAKTEQEILQLIEKNRELQQQGKIMELENKRLQKEL